MVRIDDIEIPTSDGRPLAATHYLSSVTPRAQLIIHGATAVPQRFYRE